MKERISKEAIEWIGTPFQHQGRKKLLGVDCIGLIVGIAKNLKLKSSEVDRTNKRVIYLHEFDRTDYSTMPSKDLLLEILGKLCTPIDYDDLDVGDIILFKFRKWPQHVGIVCENKDGEYFFVHASQPVKKTILSRYDERWKRQSAGCFRFPSVNFT